MANEFTLNEYDESADFIRKRTQHRPKIGIVLGTGLLSPNRSSKRIVFTIVRFRISRLVQSLVMQED